MPKSEASDASSNTSDQEPWRPEEFSKGKGTLSESDEDKDQDDLVLDLEKAKTFKEKGNLQFSKGQWENAIDIYQQGLKFLPKPKPLSNSKDEENSNDNNENENENIKENSKDKDNQTSDSAKIEEITESEPSIDQDTKECSKLRSVYFCNMAACYIKLESWQEVVDCCTEALEEAPDYTKARTRRAQANEKLGTWTSLSSALEDQKALPQTTETRASIRRIEPKLEEQKKKETDEMLGKMKNLGNNLLGRFGLSTDNFQFVKGEDGSYKVNFVQ